MGTFSCCLNTVSFIVIVDDNNEDNDDGDNNDCCILEFKKIIYMIKNIMLFIHFRDKFNYVTHSEVWRKWAMNYYLEYRLQCLKK